MKKIFLGLGLVAAVLGAIALVKLGTTLRAKARQAPSNEDVEKLFAGLQQYKEQVGRYPTGGNAQVLGALRGQHQKNILIILNLQTQLNDKGELLDAWGTPLRIYFSDQQVLVRSAGPNRRFDDSASRDFDDTIRSN